MLLYQIRIPEHLGRSTAFRPVHGVHGDALSVGSDGDQTVEIGAQSGRMTVVQTGEHVFMRMAEGVLETV